MTSSFTLGILGATGRLGSKIFYFATKDERISHVNGSARNAGELLPTLETIEKSDLIIDVSSHEATKDHVALCIEKSKPLIIGTTGHPYPIEEFLKEASNKIPIFYAPNFSIGVSLYTHAAKFFSQKLPSLGKITLQDIHHAHKKDRPSGTALLIASAIGKEKVEISSERIGEVIAEHTITFFCENEEITLVHKASSRDLYAKGALLSAFFLHGKPPGLYHMEDLAKVLE